MKDCVLLLCIECLAFMCVWMHARMYACIPHECLVCTGARRGQLWAARCKCWDLNLHSLQERQVLASCAVSSTHEKFCFFKCWEPLKYFDRKCRNCFSSFFSNLETYLVPAWWINFLHSNFCPVPWHFCIHSSLGFTVGQQRLLKGHCMEVSLFLSFAVWWSRGQAAGLCVHLLFISVLVGLDFLGIPPHTHTFFLQGCSHSFGQAALSLSLASCRCHSWIHSHFSCPHW